MCDMQISAHEKQSPLQGIIHKLYIDPIKTVVFVDDQFPTYGSLLQSKLTLETEDIDINEVIGDDALLDEALGANQEDHEPLSPPVQGKDLEESILQLVKECINLGYTPYVENKHEANSAIFKNADLLVIDYKLDPQNHHNALPCLNILKDLNKSSKLSLISIYTNDPPQEVARDIVIGLRGGGRCGVTQRSISDEISEQKLMEFLGDYVHGSDVSLGVESSSLGIDIETFKGMLEKLARRRYCDLSGAWPKNKMNESLQSGVTENGRPWIRGENIFLIILPKTRDDDIHLKFFISQMTNALCNHGPTPISMVAQASINALVSKSPEVVENIFGDDLTNAALLFHTLSGSHPTKGNNNRHFELRSRELVNNVMTSVASTIHDSIVDDTCKVLHSITPKSLLEPILLGRLCDADLINIHRIALDLEKASVTDKNDLFFALNKFLCSEKHVIDYITTGTIFKAKGEYWVCASPACDLIPRKRGSSCQRGSLDPANYFVACKLGKASSVEREQALNDAEQGKYIFVQDGEKKLALSIINPVSNIPSPYIFYVNNGCYVDNEKTAKVYRVTSTVGINGSIELSLKGQTATILSQLRPTYAARILQQVGLYNSRIGIDFRNSIEEVCEQGGDSSKE